MDASLRLRSVQHDKVVSFRALFFVIPSESEESRAWMLRFAQHDKRGVIPNALFLSFRARARNPVWMLHCAYAPFSMTSAVSFRALFFCHSERMRGIQYGCFAPFSMTSAVSFRTLFFVIPSESEESRAWMLRFAQHHRVVMSSTFVVFTQF
jgi:hypothetical protein